LVIREGLRDLPPFSSAAMRFALAAAVMVIIAPIIRRREGGSAPPRWMWVASGTLNFGASYAIVYWCEQFLPSGLVSLLWAVFPMLMAVAGHCFLAGERLRGVQWFGFGLGLAGMVLLFKTDVQRISADAWKVGAILLMSPVVSVFGTTIVKKYGEGVSSALLNRNGMFLGAAILGALAALTESHQSIEWTGRAIFSVGYLAIVGTVTTFSLYFWLLRHAPAYKLSVIAYVTPAVALFLGWALAGEPVTVFTLLGAALILMGVVLIVRR
jgi:drug/metabolite transporter (DMT)-like permease